MPPRKSDTGRKSDASVAVAAEKPAASPEQEGNTTIHAETSTTEAGKQQPGDRREKEKDHDKPTIEDFTLPRSIITRLTKGVLPPNTQVQGNAILAMSKSTTVFINYLAAQCVPVPTPLWRSEANDDVTVQTKSQ